MLAPAALRDVHPLGKSPVLTLTPTRDGARPVVLAESAVIAEYLVEHFGRGTSLEPARWRDDERDCVGGETDAWLRYKYLLGYVEGSLMPLLLLAVVAKCE
jgi:glutathione S-transferase